MKTVLTCIEHHSNAMEVIDPIKAHSDNQLAFGRTLRVLAVRADSKGGFACHYIMCDPEEVECLLDGDFNPLGDKEKRLYTCLVQEQRRLYRFVVFSARGSSSADAGLTSDFRKVLARFRGSKALEYECYVVCVLPTLKPISLESDEPVFAYFR